ncbi:MAG: hypothetical protein ABL894_08945 [Hyphomicrobium sp.]
MKGLFFYCIVLVLIGVPVTAVQAQDVRLAQADDDQPDVLKQEISGAALSAFKAVYSRYKTECSSVCTEDCKKRWGRLIVFREKNNLEVDAPNTAVCNTQEP